MDRNVLLIVLDSARRDAYLEIGHTHEKADISYQNARSAACWSVPSHASMFTGQVPSDHGHHAYNLSLDLSSIDTICDRWAGETIGISSNVYASTSYGFGQIFDQFLDVPRYQPFFSGLDATQYLNSADSSGIKFYLGYLREALSSGAPMRSLVNGTSAQLTKLLMGRPIPEPADRGARATLRKLEDTIEAVDQPIFGFANLMETHVPYSYFRGIDSSIVDETAWTSRGITHWDLIYKPDQHAEDIDLMRQYHRATVEYVTRQIADFAERFPDTTIIVTSDHGENLGYEEEDGLWGHTSSLSDALTNIPMDILNAPENIGEVNDLVSHLDLPEMVCEFGRGDVPEVSRSVAPAESVGRAPAEKPPSDQDHWDRNIRVCWRDDGATAQWEVDGEAPAWGVDQFDVSISELRNQEEKRADSGKEVDSATEARLEDLGYL